MMPKRFQKKISTWGRVCWKFFETSWLYHFDKLMLFKLKSLEIKVKQCIFDNHKKKSRTILQVEEKMVPKTTQKLPELLQTKGNQREQVRGAF